MKQENHYQAIVLGAGPAGLTAGIYLSRSRIKTLILDTGTPGGQMVLTHEIANYPGVENMSGYQLASVMKRQAAAFGCKIKSNVSLENISLDAGVKKVKLQDGTEFTSDVVILAPRGRSRTLNVPSENKFKGHGISYCATCDGDFFTGKEIVVVGGGNSALEEAVSLTKYASKVTIVHQFDHFQAFDYAVEEARNHPKINFIMESTITGFFGNEKLDYVEIKNLKNNTITQFTTDGVFVFIGYVANTEYFKDKIVLDIG